MSSNNTYIITEQQRLNFKPTYLCIKQHKITGLKYFGKTIKDPLIYNGSGKYWKKHIKKYGKEIKTIWTHFFNDVDELVHTALTLSELFDIVESTSWANMKPEDGLSGGDTSKSENYKVGMKNYHSTNDKSKYATYGMLGKPQSKKFLNSIKQANCCPVMCNGIEFPSVGDAQKYFPGINIRKRLDSSKYPNFFRLRDKTKRK